MTNEEVKNIYNNILQEFGQRLSQAMEQAFAIANDAMHHKLNVLLNGARLSLNAPEQPSPQPPNSVAIPVDPIDSKKEEIV